MIPSQTDRLTDRFNCNCNILTFNYYFPNPISSQATKKLGRKHKVSLSQSFSKKYLKKSEQICGEMVMNSGDDKIYESKCQLISDKFSTVSNWKQRNLENSSNMEKISKDHNSQLSINKILQKQSRYDYSQKQDEGRKTLETNKGNFFKIQDFRKTQQKQAKKIQFQDNFHFNHPSKKDKRASFVSNIKNVERSSKNHQRNLTKFDQMYFKYAASMGTINSACNQSKPQSQLQSSVSSATPINKFYKTWKNLKSNQILSDKDENVLLKISKHQ